MEPQNGNIVAISFGAQPMHQKFLSNYRVRFSLTSKPIEAVLCSDLYADKIQREKNLTSKNTIFQDAFENKITWICPNLNSTLEITNQVNNIKVEIVSCDDQSSTKYDSYANGTQCEEFAGNYPKIRYATFSTNFNPDLYASDKVLQLREDDLLIRLDEKYIK